MSAAQGTACCSLWGGLRKGGSCKPPPPQSLPHNHLVKGFVGSDDHLGGVGPDTDVVWVLWDTGVLHSTVGWKGRGGRKGEKGSPPEWDGWKEGECVPPPPQRVGLGAAWLPAVFCLWGGGW